MKMSTKRKVVGERKHDDEEEEEVLKEEGRDSYDHS